MRPEQNKHFLAHEYTRKNEPLKCIKPLTEKSLFNYINRLTHRLLKTEKMFSYYKNLASKESKLKWYTTKKFKNRMLTKNENNFFIFLFQMLITFFPNHLNSKLQKIQIFFEIFYLILPKMFHCVNFTI